MNNDSGLPRERLWQPVTGKWFGVIFGFSDQPRGRRGRLVPLAAKFKRTHT